MPVLCSVHFEQDLLRLLPVADSIGMKRKQSLMLNRLNITRPQKAADEPHTDHQQKKVCRPMFVFICTKPPLTGLESDWTKFFITLEGYC